MGTDAPDSWVFDSLVNFLRGPIWNVPILTLVENKSLVFEPDGEEHHAEEYKKIHEDYKNLVDFMLGSYMEDIGISAKEFEVACSQGKKITGKFHQQLFEQVWAADDYEIFKRMMIQKNLDLQMEALELLQQRYGVLPESLQPPEGMQPTETEDQVEVEEKVMAEVSRQSKEEHQAHVAALGKEEAELEQALAHSLDEHQRLVVARKNQELLLAEHFRNINLGEQKASEIAAPVTFTSTEKVDPEELAKRTAFLKGQRDKLLAMKRAEREKQLAAAESMATARARPKSAKAARSALSHGRSSHQVDPKTLEIRRSLAQKLRDEVVGGLE